MANISSIVPVDLEEVSKLKFIKDTVGYLYRESRQHPWEVAPIHIIDKDSYEKIEARFNNPINKYNLKSGDKIYIFPGCKIPMFKIKEHCKSIGVKITNDYKEATVFISTEKSVLSHTYEERRGPINYFVGYANWNVSEFKANQSIKLLGYNSGYYKDVDLRFNYAITGNEYGEFNKYIAQGQHWSKTDASLDFIYYITPLCARILYDILANKKPIVTEDSFYKSIPSAIVIDDEMYQSLNSILESSDEENHILAFQTIANCDYDASVANLYKLLDNHSSKILYSRYKNLKVFVDQHDLRGLSRKDPSEYLAYMFDNYRDMVDANSIKDVFMQECKNLADRLGSELVDVYFVPKNKYNELFDQEFTIKYEL